MNALLVSVLCGVATSVVLVPGAAASEDERALSATLAYATFSIPDHSPNGVVLGVDYGIGLSEAMAVRVSGGLGTYFSTVQSYSGHATVGLTYLLDVLKYVPYGTVAVGALVLGGGDIELTAQPLLEAGVGLDILRRRDFSYGVLARYEYWLDRTAFYTAGARMTWRWGFF